MKIIKKSGDGSTIVHGIVIVLKMLSHIMYQSFNTFLCLWVFLHYERFEFLREYLNRGSHEIQDF